MYLMRDSSRYYSYQILAQLQALFFITSFQSVEHQIGMKGTASRWFTSYLPVRYNFVHVNDESCRNEQVSHGVPQDSVLGPLLFTLFMLPLGKTIRKHSICFHCNADDTLIYSLMMQDETHQLAYLQTCLKDNKN